MVRGLRVGTAPLENATLGVPVSFPVQESVVKGKGQRPPACVVPWDVVSVGGGWLRLLLTGRALSVRLAGQWRLCTTWHTTVGERSILGQRMTCVSRPLGKQWEKKGKGRARCHTEGSAPAKQDGGSLVVRTRSRHPRTAPSTLVWGRVVTALCRVYWRTSPSARGAWEG